MRFVARAAGIDNGCSLISSAKGSSIPIYSDTFLFSSVLVDWISSMYETEFQSVLSYTMLFFIYIYLL